MSGTQKELYRALYMKETYQTGLRGENTAEKYLHDHLGMICLERRYRTKCGEIDLIMKDEDTIVFVEVKTRKTGTPGIGLMSVNPAKQKRIFRGAVIYLMNNHQLNQPVRFDVIEVNQDTIIHIPDAFQPGGMFYR